MKISEHIEVLKAAQEKFGDLELYRLGIESGNDWIFPLVVPKMEIVMDDMLTGEYNINPELMTDGKLLMIKNLHTCDRDRDDISNHDIDYGNYPNEEDNE